MIFDFRICRKELLWDRIHDECVSLHMSHHDCVREEPIEQKIIGKLFCLLGPQGTISHEHTKAFSTPASKKLVLEALGLTIGQRLARCPPMQYQSVKPCHRTQN